MRAAWEQCDSEFSWSMYTLVCGCVQNLNMHNLDQVFSSPVMDPKSLSDGADHHRKGFWALVLVDLFFRLLHDKPAILTANMAEWHVNLPSIDTAAEPVIPTLTFFVRSRLTFLLLRLDILSHDGEDKNSVIKRIEGLCEEIEALFLEWSVVSLSWCWFSALFILFAQIYILLPNNSVLLTGYTVTGRFNG